MKKLELKLEKHILLLENDGLIKRYKKNSGLELFCDGHFWKPVCVGSGLDDKQIIDIVKTTWINDDLESCNYKNYNPNGTGSFSYPKDSIISAIENAGFYWKNNSIKEPKPDNLNNSLLDKIRHYNELVSFYEAEDKTFDPTKTLILEKI